MRKTSIFLALIAVTVMFATVTDTYAQTKKKKKVAPVTTVVNTESHNLSPNAMIEALKSQLAEKDRFITQLSNQNSANNALREKYDECVKQNNQGGANLAEAYDEMREIERENDSLYSCLEKLQRENKTFITTTSEISDLVRDSMVINLVKNMELGLKFYQMSAEELASRYSGLSLNWQRAPDERYLLSRKAIEDISTRALQSEMLKWMRYLYDKSVSAERLRLSKLFLNITGDNYFERKY